MSQVPVDDGVLLVGDPLDQVAVVGDHQQRAGPGVEQVLHRGQHVGVNVVRRLIEDQDVGFREQHQQQLQPPLLPTGQLPHPGRQVLAGEAEPLQQLCRGEFATVDLIAGPGPGQHLADPVAGDLGQRVELLVEHRQLHGLPALHPSGRRSHRARDQAQQGRFAGTVGTHDRGPLAGSDPPFDAAQHLVVAEPDAGVDQVDDVLAEPRGGQPAQLQPVPGRRDVLDQLIGRVDPELRFGRPGRRPAAQPSQLFAHQVLPFGFDSGRLPVALHPLQHVGGVATLERFDDPVVHLPGGGGDLVQEPAVVGDHQQPAGVARPASVEVGGQPGDALDVEMVGGLVECHHVPVTDQQGGQRDPAALPAAEGVHRRLEVEICDQTGQHVPDLRVGRPGVVGLVTDDRGPHRHTAGERVLLGEHADPHVAAPAHPAAVRFEASGQQPQQRRLAVAVATDDADPVALVDAERHRVEHDPGRILQVQRLGSEQKTHRSRVGGRPRCAGRRPAQDPPVATGFLACSALSTAGSCSRIQAMTS